MVVSGIVRGNILSTEEMLSHIYLLVLISMNGLVSIVGFFHIEVLHIIVRVVGLNGRSNFLNIVILHFHIGNSTLLCRLID